MGNGKHGFAHLVTRAQTANASAHKMGQPVLPLNRALCAVTGLEWLLHALQIRFVKITFVSANSALRDNKHVGIGVVVTGLVVVGTYAVRRIWCAVEITAPMTPANATEKHHPEIHTSQECPPGFRENFNGVVPRWLRASWIAVGICQKWIEQGQSARFVIPELMAIRM